MKVMFHFQEESGGKQTVAVSLMFLLLELDIDVLKVLVTGLNLSGKMQWKGITCQTKNVIRMGQYHR